MIHRETCPCGAAVMVRGLRPDRVKAAVKGWRRDHRHPEAPDTTPGEPYRGEHGGGAHLEPAMEPLGVDVRRRAVPIGFGLGTIMRDGEGPCW